MGRQITTTSPPGESTSPLSKAVYPSRVCKNSGSRAVLP